MNDDDSDHHEKIIDEFINLSKTQYIQTFVKPAKITKIKDKAHDFFSFTAGSVSGIFQRRRKTLTTTLKRFKLTDLKIATGNFSPENKLGSGYSQRVFIGWLNEKKYSPSKIGVGMAVAVKRFHVTAHSLEARKAIKHSTFSHFQHSPYLLLLPFDTNCLLQLEVEHFGKFNHLNLVKLLGYCWEDEEFLIVYEYLEKGSLDKHFFKEGSSPLSWNTRLKIMIGAARGLCFLHNAENGIMHRKIKTSNILLDGDFNAKLADFGLAKFGSVEKHTGLTESMAGAYGYLAPEYIATGCWYAKSDVYGFGAVLLEMLTGKRVKDEFWCNDDDDDDDDDLVEWARVILQDEIELKKLIDPRLDNEYPLKAAIELGSLILKCLETFPSDRPSGQQVLEYLEHMTSM